jgi:hypothetical protein
MPDNCTALYDAWGSAIVHENERKRNPNNPYLIDVEKKYMELFNLTDSGLTQEPYSFLFKSFPKYCKWFDTFNRELNK